MFLQYIFVLFFGVVRAGIGGPLLDSTLDPRYYWVELTLLYDRDSINGTDLFKLQNNVTLDLHDRLQDDSVFQEDRSFFVQDFENAYLGQKQLPLFFEFIGVVTIEFEVVESTSVVRVLVGEKITILHSESSIRTECALGEEYVFSCRLHEAVQPGAIFNITIQYTSYFTDKCYSGRGPWPWADCVDDQFGAQQWAMDKDGKLYLFTSIAPSGARNLFPSLDEPMFKSRFQLTVTGPRDMDVFSNERSTIVGRDDRRIRTTQFETTRKLSTYLIAMVAGHFSVSSPIERSGVTWRQIRLTAMIGSDDKFEKDSRSFVDRASNFYAEAIKLLDTDPNLSSKIDLVGIPGYISAMENPGLIVFNEGRFMVKEEQIRGFSGDISELAEFQHVIQTTAHEIAHQWFGNLVTMRWWNDVWLSEGLATYLEVHLLKSVENEFPDLYTNARVFRRSAFLGQLRTKGVMAFEKVTMDTDSDNLYSKPVYDKSCMALQMLQEVVGEHVILRGLRLYLAKHQNSAANANDFFQCIQQSINQYGVFGPDAELLNVNEFMHEWVYSIELPEVTVRRSDLNTIELSQKSLKTSDNTLWKIPVMMRVVNERVTNVVTLWLTEQNVSVHIEYDHSESLIFLENPFMLYKVKYDDLSNAIILQTFTNNCYRTRIESLMVMYLDSSMFEKPIELCRTCLEGKMLHDSYFALICGK